MEHIEKTAEEIAVQLDLAIEIIASVGTKVRGMTYEEGVRYALEWVLGHSDEAPIETDES